MIIKQLLESKPSPITIQSNKTVEDAMRLLLENKIGSLVVVDRDDLPKGIITEHDIFNLAHRFRGDMMDMSVRDNMSSDLHTANPEDGIDRVASLMIEKRIRHIPIIDGNNKLRGIISMRDVVKALIGKASPAL